MERGKVVGEMAVMEAEGKVRTDDVFTIEDNWALKQMPVGIEIEERDGSTFTLTEDGFVGNCASCGWVEGMVEAEIDYPVIVRNPEILGDFTEPAPAFKIGDRVVKTTVAHLIADRGLGWGYDYEETEAKKGERGIITGDASDTWNAPSFSVRWDSGKGSVIAPKCLGRDALPEKPEEPKVVEVGDIISAANLKALPPGSVVVVANYPEGPLVKAGASFARINPFCDPEDNNGRPDTYSLPLEYLASAADRGLLTLVYRPARVGN